MYSLPHRRVLNTHDAAPSMRNVIAELWEDICRDFAQILLKQLNRYFKTLHKNLYN